MLSRAELIESLQEHFFERLGKKDWNDSQELTGEFTSFTLFPEEIEELLLKVPSGRQGIAIILEAMNATAKQLHRIKTQSRQKERAMSEADIVERFKNNIKNVLLQLPHTSERSPIGRKEYCAA